METQATAIFDEICMFQGANLRGEFGSTPKKNLRVRQLDAHAERGLGTSKQE